MLLVIALMGGCSIFSTRDGAPRPPAGFDINKVPDAVPKAEPLSKYGNPESYEVFGKKYYVLKSAAGYQEQGKASWYGTKFHGKRTSSGEPYDMYQMTAAHKSLPLPTYVRVRNLENDQEVIVKVNDRGPFHSERVIDLSYAAALKLGVFAKGTARVEVTAIDVAKPVERDLNIAGLFIQVGAFRERENAARLQDRLTRSAFRSGIQEASLNGKDKVFRVRVGPFDDRQTADQVAQNLIDMGLNGAKVISD